MPWYLSILEALTGRSAQRRREARRKGRSPARRGRVREKPLAVEALEDRVVMATVQGTVYNDLNNNGDQNTGEPGVAGVLVWNDDSNNGVWDGSIADPDAYAGGTNISTGFSGVLTPGVALSAGASNGAVYSRTSTASTGSRVFSSTVSGSTTWSGATTLNGRFGGWDGTTIDEPAFSNGVKSVAIDAIGVGAGATVTVTAKVIRVSSFFGVNYSSFDEVATQTVTASGRTTIVVSAPGLEFNGIGINDYRIVGFTVSSTAGVNLDNLRYSATESFGVSDANGSYSVGGLSNLSNSLIRIANPPGFNRNTETGAIVTTSGNQTRNFGLNSSVSVGGATNVTYTEDSPATPIAPNVTFTDADNGGAGNITGIEIYLSSPAGSGNQLLVSTAAYPQVNVVDSSGSYLYVTAPAGSMTNADWQTFVRSITYRDNSNTPPTAARSVILFAYDQNGDASYIQYNLNVVPNNDPPAISGSGFTVLEDSWMPASGFTLSDPDDSGGNYTLTLTATNGAVTLVNTAGLSITAGANGTSSVTIQGNRTNINNALAAMLFRGSSNFAGNASLNITVNDQNNGGGANGALQRSFDYTVVVTAVNDAPTINTPADGATYDDNKQSSITGVSFSDVDVPQGSQVAFTALFDAGLGKVNIPLTGLTVVEGANDSDYVRVTGTLAALNAAAAALKFTPPDDYLGPVSFYLELNDNGNTGAAGYNTPILVSKNFSFTIVPKNDAPVVNVPPTQSTPEDAPKSISGINVADSDANQGTGIVEVQITTTNGTSTLTTTNGLSFFGGQNGSASFTVRGTIDDLNAALATLEYTPVANFTGAATITVRCNDLGNTGAPGPLETTRSFTVNVTAVNDAPTISTPATVQNLSEDTGAFITGVSIADIDAGSATNVTLTLTAQHGNINITSAAGLTSISGNNTKTVTLTGTVAALNAVLFNRVQYFPDLNFNGLDSVEFTVDDKGNTGTGGPLTATGAVSVFVSAVNDPPVIAAPTTATTTEDVEVPISGVVISDPDAGDGVIEVSLAASNGTLSLGVTNNLTFLFGTSASGSASIVFRGKLADVNAALATLKFKPALDFNGTAIVQYGASDLGNTGAGGVQNAIAQQTQVTVQAVNDPPVISAPNVYVVDEDVATPIPGVSISDPDALANDQLKVTIAPKQGTVSVVAQGGAAVAGNNSTSLVITGTLAQINATLATLVYRGNADFNGDAEIKITADDQGHNGAGAGSVSTSEKTIALTVRAVNDAPDISVPYPNFNVNEDVDHVITGITVADVDAGDGEVQITITTANGLLTLGSTAGLTFITGDGAADQSLRFRGKLSDVQAALASLTYRGRLNYNGLDTITFEIDDLGNTGAGPRAVDLAQIGVVINSVNDAPTINLPGGLLTLPEDGAYPFAGVSVADVDVTEGGVLTREMELTISATSGVLTLGTTAGLDFSVGDGTSDYTMTFRGTLAEINAALAGLVYTPILDFFGADVVFFTVNDLGNFGLDGTPLVTTNYAVMQITGVNDAPTVSIPGPFATPEETALTIWGARVDDADSRVDPIKVTVTAGNGTVTPATTAGLTVLAGAFGTNTVTFTGDLAAINAALFSLSYQPNVNFTGPDTIRIDVADLGRNGVGGPRTGSGVINITVIANNDPPAITVPGPQTVQEDAPLAIPPISVSDPDAGAANVQVDLSVSNGTLAVGNLNGATLTAIGIGAIRLTGTLAQLNAALATITYQGLLNFNGADSLQIAVNDLGNTGAGGPQITTASVAINVVAVNDAPVVNNPGPLAVDEDANLTITTLSVTDVDSASGNIRVTLAVFQGTLTLSTTAGLTFAAGDGIGDSVITMDGTVAAINAALNGLVYRGFLNFNGTDSLFVTVNDNGNTGLGGPMFASASYGITVNAINDGPVLNLPPAQTVQEDGAFNLSTLGVVDVDSGTGNLQVTVTATNGTLTAFVLAGVTATGNGTGSVTLTGQLGAINAAMASLQYRPNLHYSGADAINVSVSDLGNTGAPGPLTASGVIAVTILPVADVPTLSTAPSNGQENTALPLNITTALVDQDGSETMSVQIAGVPTTATLSAGVNLGNGVWQLTQAQLAGLSLLANDNGSFNLTITVTTTESANGSTATASAFLPIAISNVNPTITGVTGPNEWVPYQTFPLGVTFSDPGFNTESFTYSVAWGDGTTSTGSVTNVTNGSFGTATTGSFSVDKHFTAIGTYNVLVTVRDDDGGQATFTKTIVVKAVVTNPGSDAPNPFGDGTALWVGGTTGNDGVSINYVNPTTIRIVVNKKTIGDYSNIGRVYVTTGAGNDKVVTNDRVTVPVVIDGGAGNDQLYGGRGNDVILGGDGKDQLYGGMAGRDVLIGGAGVDTLKGRSASGASADDDSDLLIADRTSYDSNLAALASIFTTWTDSTITYANRVDTIRPTLSGNVFNDAEKDSLFGGAGDDWFWIGTGDAIKDKVSAEFSG